MTDEVHFRNSVRPITEKIAEIVDEMYDRNLDDLADRLRDVARPIYSHTVTGDYPPQGLLFDAVRLLKDQGVRFALIGGLAVNVHGQSRSTDDINLVIHPMLDSTKTKDSDYMRQFGFYRSKSSTGTIQVLDWRRGGGCEVLLANTPLMDYALQTAEEITVLRVGLPVISADALVGMKIHVCTENPGRKSKDIPDIVSVLLRSRPDLSSVRSFLSPEETSLLDQIVSTTY